MPVETLIYVGVADDGMGIQTKSTKTIFLIRKVNSRETLMNYVYNCFFQFIRNSEEFDTSNYETFTNYGNFNIFDTKLIPILSNLYNL